MKLALAGGGTAGHISPGLAVLARMRQEGKLTSALFFSIRRSGINPREKYPSHRWILIGAAPPPRRPVGWPMMVGKNLAGYCRSCMELRRFKPDLLLGLGGFVSVPPLLAARTLSIPVVLYEQNTVLGRANRLFRGSAARILAGFPLENISSTPAVLTGNPVSPRARNSAPPKDFRRGEDEKRRFTVMVMGGSRGARGINRLMISAAPLLAAKKSDIRFIHLSGEDDRKTVASAYRRHGISAEVYGFLREMGWAYSRADILIARAGAATLTEASFWGLPLIVIPYPWAADDHQLANAGYFSKNGAGLVFEQDRITPAEMVKLITDLSEDRERVERMKKACRALTPSDPEGAIIRELEEVLRK